MSVRIRAFGLQERASIRYLLSLRFEKIVHLERFVAISQTVTAISQLVHELQRERGTSNLFLKGADTQVGDRLAQQTRKCTELRQNLLIAFKGIDRLEYGAVLVCAVAIAAKGLHRLDEWRGKVKQRSISPAECTAAYSEVIAALLTVVQAATDIHADRAMSHALLAYYNLMQGKEFAGQERALGAAAFSAGRFDPAQYRRLLYLGQAQERSLAEVVRFATPDQEAALADVMGRAPVAAVEGLREIARQGGLAGNLQGIQGTHWFDLTTQRIDALKMAEDRFAADLMALCDTALVEARGLLAGDLGVPDLHPSLSLRLYIWFMRRRMLNAAARQRRLFPIIRTLAASGQAPTSPLSALAAQLYRNGDGEESFLAAYQDSERRAREQRHQALEDAIHDIGATTDSVLAALNDASRTMQGSARRMSDNAVATTARSAHMGSAAQDALAAVGGMARAAEELARAIEEVNRHADQSLKVAEEAVAQSSATQAAMQELSEAAGQIDKVTDLIRTIASQTNLLALNATIEAARAGEAGRGFAVVAGEVKTLAGQTGRATEDIDQQISAIQTAFAAAIPAIVAVGGRIASINEIVTRTAAALVQQQAATARISENLRHVEIRMSSVHDGAGAVSAAAGDTGVAADQVLVAAESLTSISSTLRTSLDSFIATLRAA